MAKYFIEDTTLVNLADKIRDVTGTTDTMSPVEMPDYLETYNDEMNTIIAEQESIIEQITAELENVSGGGANINTCTINLALANASITKGVYTKHENGTTSLVELSSIDSSTTFENVVCNSIIWMNLSTMNGSFSSSESDGIRYIGCCCTDPCYYVEESATSCTISIDGNMW